VVGEAFDGCGGDVGHDGLDLTAGQGAGAPRRRCHRQAGERASGVGDRRCAAPAEAVVGQPGFHRGGALGLPAGGGVEGADGVGEVGAQPVVQAHQLGQALAGGRHHQVVDGPTQCGQRIARLGAASAVAPPGTGIERGSTVAAAQVLRRRRADRRVHATSVRVFVALLRDFLASDDPFRPTADST
jgi:hypothetical protein